MRRALALVAVVVLAGVAPASAASRTTVVRVAVQICATSVGADTPAPPPLAPERVRVPSGLVGRVALYVDRDQRVAPVLGPKGWSCRAQDAADGQAGVEILARTVGAVGLVSASSDGPCVTCVYRDVCRFTRHAVGSGPPAGVACPGPAPGESRQFISGSPSSARALLHLSERPGARYVAGDWPTRRPVSVVSHVALAYDLTAPGARVVTCALAQGYASLCPAVVNRLR